MFDWAPLYFDIETDGLDAPTKVHCVGLALDDEAPYLLVDDYAISFDDVVRNEAAETIVGHNIIGYDLPTLSRLGHATQAAYAKRIVDTLVMSQYLGQDLSWVPSDMAELCPPELSQSHSLKAWGYRLGLHKDESPTDWSRYTDEMGEYCKQDVVVTRALHKFLGSQLRPEDDEPLRMAHRVQTILQSQQEKGIRFDVAAAQKLVDVMEAEQTQTIELFDKLVPPVERTAARPEHYVVMAGAAEIGKTRTKAEAVELRKRLGLKPKEVEIIDGPREVTLERINLGSRSQVADYLIGLGWQPKEMTPTGRPKIDADVLAEVPESIAGASALAHFYQNVKHLGMLSNGDGSWLNCVAADGRIHGQVTAIGTATHRATHSHPNLAQVPSGKEFRSLFVPSDGHVFVGADLEGIELRMLAHYSGDAKLIDEINSGDAHSMFAEIYGTSRQDGKAITYGFIYGMGDKALGKRIGGSKSDGVELRERLYAALPGLAALANNVQNVAAQYGKLKALDGRYIYVRKPYSALNFLLQSAGSIVSHYWMHAANRALARRLNLQASQLLWVHDEFLFECPNGDHQADYVAEVVEAAAITAGSMLEVVLPTPASAKVGMSWAEVH